MGTRCTGCPQREIVWASVSTIRPPGRFQQFPPRFARARRTLRMAPMNSRCPRLADSRRVSTRRLAQRRKKTAERRVGTPYGKMVDLQISQNRALIRTVIDCARNAALGFMVTGQNTSLQLFCGVGITAVAAINKMDVQTCAERGH
jgi:hypothetical protein